MMHIYLFNLNNHDRVDIENATVEQLVEWFSDDVDLKYDFNEFADKMNNEEYLEVNNPYKLHDDLIIDFSQYWMRIT